MSKIESILEKYINSSRQTGHTTLAINGARHYDKKFLIIAHTQKYAEEIYRLVANPNGIPLSMNSSKLEQYSHLPALIDNSVILMKLEALQNDIKTLDRIIDKKRSEISKLRKMIGRAKGELIVLAGMLRTLTWTKILFRFKSEKSFIVRRVRGAQEDLTENKDSDSKYFKSIYDQDF